jgi:hypothetical protein
VFFRVLIWRRGRVSRLVALSFILRPLSQGGADVLRYHDGTVLPGELLRIEGDTYVFRSPRFGELRAQRAEAMVERAVNGPSSGATEIAATLKTGAADAPATPRMESAPDGKAGGKAGEWLAAQKCALDWANFFSPGHF